MRFRTGTALDGPSVIVSNMGCAWGSMEGPVETEVGLQWPLLHIIAITASASRKDLIAPGTYSFCGYGSHPGRWGRLNAYIGSRCTISTNRQGTVLRLSAWMASWLFEFKPHYLSSATHQIKLLTSKETHTQHDGIRSIIIIGACSPSQAHHTCAHR